MMASARGLPARRDFVDAGVGLAEIVGGEMGERLFKARGTRRRARYAKAEGQ